MKYKIIYLLMWLLAINFSISAFAESPSTVQDEMDRQLLGLVRTGDLQEVEKFLLAVANPNAKDKHDQNNTALHYAAMEGHTAIVEILLQHGADPLVVNDFNQTPAMVAKNRSIANTLNQDGTYSPPSSKILRQKQLDEQLIIATIRGDFDQAIQVLEAGANPNATDDREIRILPLRLSTGEVISVEQRFGWEGMSVLFLSVMHSDAPLVDALIKKGANINTVLIVNITEKINVLSDNLSVRDPRTRQILQYHNARKLPPDVNERSIKEQQMDSSLLVAAAHGNVQQMLEHLEAGANPNVADHNNTTALHWAAISHNVDAVRVLVAYGANPNAITAFSETVSNWTTNTDIRSILRKRSWTSSGLTANSYSDYYVYTTNDHSQQEQLDDQLHRAIHGEATAYNKKEAITAMRKAIALGADVNAIYKNVATNMFGQRIVRIYTPLHLAIQTNHIEAIRILLNQGASITFPYRIFALYQGDGNDQQHVTHQTDHQTHYEGMHTHYEITLEASPINLALRGENTDAQNLIEVFRDHDLLDMNVPLDQTGQTLLHQAARDNDTSTASSLLQLGANPNMKDRQNRLAAQVTTEPEIEVLIFSHKNFESHEFTIDELAQIYGKHPQLLFAVVKYGSVEAVKEILTTMQAQGVDINTMDTIGNNFLHWASLRGDLEIIQLLMSAGVRSTELNKFNKSGQTPIDVAKNHEVATFISALIAPRAAAQELMMEKCLTSLTAGSGN